MDPVAVKILGFLPKPANALQALNYQHGNRVVMPGQLRAVLRRQFVRRPEREAAAVIIDEHRTFARQGASLNLDLRIVEFRKCFFQVAPRPCRISGALLRDTQ